MNLKPSIFQLYSSRVCNICNEIELKGQNYTNSNDGKKKLFLCSNCNLIKYCSKEHQKYDWHVHKDFCRAVKFITQIYNVQHILLINGIPQNYDALKQTIRTIKCLIQGKLKRALLYHEEELTSFPIFCAYCFNPNAKIHCIECNGVSYCNLIHKTADAEQHVKHCIQLQLYYCRYKVLSFEQNLCRNSHKRIPKLSETNLLDAFKHYTDLKLTLPPTKTLSDYNLYSKACDYSCIATLAFALELDLKEFDLALTIYIVGAQFERLLWFQREHIKFLCTQFPQLTYLKLYFVGPEVAIEENEVEKLLHNNKIYTIELQSIRKCIEQFITETAVVPDYFIVFNCGFSENSDNEINIWKLGILSMLKTYNVPLIFTSYTLGEANLDLKAVEDVAKEANHIHISHKLPITKNKYCDMRPQRDWQYESSNEMIFYRNGYIQIVESLKNI